MWDVWIFRVRTPQSYLRTSPKKTTTYSTSGHNKSRAVSECNSVRFVWFSSNLFTHALKSSLLFFFGVFDFIVRPSVVSEIEMGALTGKAQPSLEGYVCTDPHSRQPFVWAVRLPAVIYYAHQTLAQQHSNARCVLWCYFNMRADVHVKHCPKTYDQLRVIYTKFDYTAMVFSINPFYSYHITAENVERLVFARCVVW